MSGFGLGADLQRSGSARPPAGGGLAASDFDERELDPLPPPPPRQPSAAQGGGFGLSSDLARAASGIGAVSGGLQPLDRAGTQRPPSSGGLQPLEPLAPPGDPLLPPPPPPAAGGLYGDPGQGPPSGRQGYAGGYGLAAETGAGGGGVLPARGGSFAGRQGGLGTGYNTGGQLAPPPVQPGDRVNSGRRRSDSPPPPPLPGPQGSPQYGGQQYGPQFNPNQLQRPQHDPRNPGQQQPHDPSRPPLQPVDPNRPGGGLGPGSQGGSFSAQQGGLYPPGQGPQRPYGGHGLQGGSFSAQQGGLYPPGQGIQPLHGGPGSQGGSFSAQQDGLYPPGHGPQGPHGDPGSHGASFSAQQGGLYPPGQGPPGDPNLDPNQHSQMQMQQNGSYISPMFNMQDLPPDERFLQLTAAQANDVMQQLDAARMAAPYMNAPEAQLVDVEDAHSTFMGSLGVQRLGYLHQLELAAPGGRLPPNAQASLLQLKLKQGSHRLQDLAQPVMDPGNQTFVDLTFSADGALKPETRCSMFSFSPVKVEGVGPTGLRSARQPCLFVSRLCLFDRQHNKFIGNVLGLRPHSVVAEDSEWLFDPKVSHSVVRCSVLQPDPRTGTRMINDEHVSLYVEFNTAYRLTVQDTKGMPASESKASQMVDEVTTCWAMIAARKCSLLTKEMEVSVPLYYGSIYNPKLLDMLYKAERKKTPFLSFFRSKEKPVFTFKIGPCGRVGQLAPLVPYGFMPPTMIALDDLAAVLGAYRLNLALQLARQASSFSAVSEPVLAHFPDILGDHHLLSEFLLKWRDITTKLCTLPNAGCFSPEVLPPIATLVEAFRRCCIEVMPLLKCATVPPKHINNFVEYQGNRLKQVQKFCHVIDPKTNTVVGARHPVEPLSHAGFEFLHKPFDVSEVRLCMGNKLEKHKTFLKY